MSKAEKIEFAEFLTFGSSQETQTSKNWKLNQLSKMYKLEKDIRKGGWAGDLEISLIVKLIERNIVIYNTRNCLLYKHNQYGYEDTIHLGFIVSEQHYVGLSPKPSQEKPKSHADPIKDTEPQNPA